MSLKPEPEDRPFFVGYLRTPAKLAVFFLYLVPVALCGVIGLSIGLSLAQPDPGSGSWAGRADLTGILETQPYPVLRVPPDDEHPAGRAILLVGQGKLGVIEQAAALDGQRVQVRGGFLRRGGMTMIQVAGRDGLVATPDEAGDESGTPAAPDPTPLGAYTLRGEIVESKCFLGAMRPGCGRTHMACANLCLLGGIPPVFVTRGPDGNEQLFLLADAEGGAVTDAVLDYVSLAVEVTGEVEQRDDLMVLRIDPEAIDVL